MSAAINIDFDHNAVPWDFVSHLSQSSPGRTRPQRCKLFRAQLDLAFFAMAAPTDLKREGCSVPRFSQTNLSTSRLGCQITLLDNKASRLFQIVRQPFDQKFSFNFAIVSRSIVPSHKLNIVNVMRSLSRLSCWPNSGSTRALRVDLGAAAERAVPLLVTADRYGGLPGDWSAHQSLPARRIFLPKTQAGVRWTNSLSALATAMIGHAEIATMMAKSSASMVNSTVLSPAR
jgi:hypothetical protein